MIKRVILLLGGVIVVGVSVYLFYPSKKTNEGISTQLTDTTRGAPEFVVSNGQPLNAKGTQKATLLQFDSTERTEIFTDASSANTYRDAVDRFVTKRFVGEYRLVTANADEFREIIRQRERVTEFQLTLLEEDPLNLVVLDAIEHSDGWQSGIATLRGRVENDEISSVAFVIAPDGEVRGSVNSLEQGLVKIDRIPDSNIHIIWRRVKGLVQPYD